MTKPMLVVMRLEDMWRRHPRQDNSRVCSKCGEKVGIYPSGQSALKADPTLAIVCNVCSEPRGDDIPAAPIEDIIREIEESKPTKDGGAP